MDTYALSVTPGFSDVISNVEKIRQSNPSVGHYIFKISKGSRVLDLFTLGRLLSLAHDLRQRSQAKVTLEFHNRTTALRSRRIHALGLPAYCVKHGIDLSLAPPPSQEPLFPTTAELRRANYWHCLVPLTTLYLPQNLTADEANRMVSQHLAGMVSDVHRELSQLPGAASQCYTELSYLFFTLLRELIHNAVVHSKSEYVTCAVAVSCETSTRSRAHTPGAVLPSGVHKYEFVVTDLGQGVVPTVGTTLRAHSFPPLKEYLSPLPWQPDFTLIRAAESAILRQLFQTNLAIRKGRRSEGLSDVAEKLRWFGGHLNYRSGRSELQLDHDDAGYTARLRPIGKPGFLPGVVAAGLLPSKALEAIALRLATSSINVNAVVHEVSRLEPLPRALFTQAGARIRTNPEIEARRLMALGRTNPHALCEINLRVSDHLDGKFLDSLLQELVKLHDDSSEAALLQRLLLADVPRQTALRLRHTSASSLLTLKHLFLLVLDESELPHFVGLPRATEALRDLEESLKAIYWAGSIARDELQRKLSLAPAVLVSLDRLVADKSTSIFHRSLSPSGEVTYNCRRPRPTKSPESHHLGSLREFCIREGEGVAFQLQNGTYVSSVVDFCQYWSDYSRVYGCARLLWEKKTSPPCDAVITFINNGDRLATAFRQLANFRRFLIVDPRQYADTSGRRQEMRANPFFSGVLIVDALYPGDSSSYISNFLSYAMRSKLGIVHEILCFADLRPEADRVNIEGVPVRAAVSDPSLSFEMGSSDARRVLVNRRHYILSKPSLLGEGNEKDGAIQHEIESLTGLTGRYSEAELSVEFWHNVSELRLLTSAGEARDERSVLFYEANERLVENRRTRRLIEARLADFLSGALQDDVDIVLHPAHSVGAYLAQSVASKLRTPPLVFPLVQREYGGDVEVTNTDYVYFASEMSKRRKGGGPLRALIIDDSVLTGRSLLNMTGVAHRLGAEVAGAFVLLNRLVDEVSEAAEILARRFDSVFRLHMPVFRVTRSPDAELRLLCESALRTSLSSAACQYARTLLAEPSHFLTAGPQVNSAAWETAADLLREKEYTESLSREIEQVIFGLILNPDIEMIDALTRVAIAYNFFQDLVRVDMFWTLLRLLATEEKQQTQASYFAEKTIYLLAASRHADAFPTKAKFEATLWVIIAELCESGLEGPRHTLAAECLLALARIESEAIFDVAVPLFGRLFPAAEPKPSQPADRLWDTEAANLAGAFALACHHLAVIKPAATVAAATRALSTTSISTRFYAIHELFLVDLLAPVLPKVESLRLALEISIRRDADQLVGLIGDRMGNSQAYRFLAEAPGYSCTLRSVLTLTAAQTVLLYGSNITEESYTVIAAESTYPRRPFDYLSPERLTDEQLPEDLKMALRSHRFFISEDVDILKIIDGFVTGLSARWVIGAPVRSLEDGLHYYVLLGFSESPRTRSAANSAYYYWTRAQRYLPDILQSIHNRHLASASAWASQLHTFRPIHNIGPATEPRRKLLQQALTFLDVGELVRRSHRLFAQPLTHYEQLRSRIYDIVRSVDHCLASARELLPRESSLAPDLPSVSIETYRPPSLRRTHHFTLPTEVLTFVLYECLWNSLSYCHSYVAVEAVLSFPERGRLPDIGLTLCVMNDLLQPATAPLDVRERRGLTACTAAAAAVGGTFSSSGAVDIEGRPHWKAVLSIHGDLVPNVLEEALYGGR